MNVNAIHQPEHSRDPHTGSGETAAKDEALEFVNIKGPPVKNDPVSRTQIKSHVMRQVHHKRKIAKSPAKPKHITQHSATRHICRSHLGISETGMMLDRQSGIGDGNDPCLMRIQGCSIPPQASSHLPEQPYPTPISTTTIYCEECGKQDLLCWPTNEVLGSAPYTADPRTTLNSGVFGPFTDLPVQVTHFMHQMIHHCEYLCDNETKSKHINQPNTFSAIFIHIPHTNPRIYGKMNQYIPQYFFIQHTGTDPAVSYCMVALGAYNQAAHLKSAKCFQASEDMTRQATFYLFKAMQLLQAKLDDPKESLSCESILIAALLTTCIVRGPYSIVCVSTLGF